MKSIARQTKLFSPWAALSLLLAVSFVNLGQKRAECGNPPTGIVTCEDDQEPFCLLRDKKFYARCKSSGQRTGATLERWVLSEALGRQVTDAEWRDPEIQQGIRSGSVTLKDASGQKVVVSFRPIQTPANPAPLKRESPSLNPKAMGEAASLDRSCDVCVVVSGALKCKRVATDSNERVKAAAAELCESDTQCLKSSPIIKCRPE